MTKRTGNTPRLRALIVAAALLASLPGSFAVAQECGADEATALAARATELYGAADYAGAVDLLEQAYACFPEDILLYNIARAYQEGGRCVPAFEYFERYVASGDEQRREPALRYREATGDCAEEYRAALAAARGEIQARNLAAAEAHVDDALDLSREGEPMLLLGDILYHQGDCAGSRRHFEGIASEPVLSDAERAQVQSAIARAEQCLAGQSCEDQREACEENRRNLIAEAEASAAGQRQIGWIVTGVGGGILLGAVIHDIVSQGTVDDYEAAAANGNAELFEELGDDIDSAKTVSFILYGVGGATAIAGLVVALTAGGGDVDIDCTGVCWDFGLGGPYGSTGAWLSAEW